MIPDTTLIKLTEEEMMILVGMFSRELDTTNSSVIFQRIRWCSPHGLANKINLQQGTIKPEHLPLLQSLVSKILSRAAG